MGIRDRRRVSTPVQVRFRSDRLVGSDVVGSTSLSTKPQLIGVSQALENSARLTWAEVTEFRCLAAGDAAELVHVRQDHVLLLDRIGVLKPHVFTGLGQTVERCSQ